MNCKQELLDMMRKHDKDVTDISWIKIAVLDKNYNFKNVLSKLTPAFEDLDVLNFEYSIGFGSMEVEGCVVFNDNTWLERGEYDGSEWWEYKSVPRFEETNYEDR